MGNLRQIYVYMQPHLLYIALLAPAVPTPTVIFDGASHMRLRLLSALHTFTSL
jgi:hypothetical protein